MKPWICYLNGISSSGKSSIAREMLRIVEEPCIYLSLDNFKESLCDKYNNDDWALYNKLCYGLHRTALQWHQLGLNVIIDNVLETKKLLLDVIETLPTEYTFYYGVKAPYDILMQREKDRGRKDFKLIKYQFDRVHKYSTYDTEFQTELKHPNMIANEIFGLMLKSKPRALKNCKDKWID